MLSTQNKISNITFVGSGISASFTLLNFLTLINKGPRLKKVLSINIIEKSSEFNTGIPYGTRSGSSTLLITSLRNFLPEPELSEFLVWLNKNKDWLIKEYKNEGGILSKKWLEIHSDAIQNNQWEDLFIPRRFFGHYINQMVEENVAHLTAKKIIEVKKENSIEKPAVFFIGGLRAFDFDLIEDGMKSMTDAVKPARLYSWNQKEEMIDEIKTRKENQPVVLVGHGLGADTAVEIAQELNTLDNRFRRVDMLVTLNSIGFNNDFIPENVLANKNYLTADNGWMDDSANIAINYKTTKVENFLRPESHADLDQSSDIQRQIINEIDRLVY